LAWLTFSVGVNSQVDCERYHLHDAASNLISSHRPNASNQRTKLTAECQVI